MELEHTTHALRAGGGDLAEKKRCRRGRRGGLSAGQGVCRGEVGDLGEARGGEGGGGGGRAF